jgi:dephospho-CoA kinase
MKVLGITGGIGMGKSACANILPQLGVPVIDTDTIARDLVQPGQAPLDEIFAAFGAGVRTPDGRLDRPALARIVFSDSSQRHRLEGILHPRIRAVWKAQVSRWDKAGVKVAAVVIPLLFETDSANNFNSVVCVACSEATQRLRLRDRAWSESQIDARLASQWLVRRKIELSQFLIWTDVPLDIHRAQVAVVLRNASEWGK